MSSELMAVGGGVSAFGALQQGQDQSATLDRAAKIERQNALLDIETGQANAELSSISSNKRIGAISASYGASGVAADSGSVLNVLAASTSNAELDRQNIIHGAKVRAVNYENAAAMDTIGSDSARKGSYMNAFASLLGAGSKMFGQSAGVAPGQYMPTRGANGAYDQYTDSGLDDRYSLGGAGWAKSNNNGDEWDGIIGRPNPYA